MIEELFPQNLPKLKFSFVRPEHERLQLLTDVIVKSDDKRKLVTSQTTLKLIKTELRGKHCVKDS